MIFSFAYDMIVKPFVSSKKKKTIYTAYVRRLALSHNLPTKIISPQVVLTADSNDPKPVWLQFHCPSHNPWVENLSCLQI